MGFSSRHEDKCVLLYHIHPSSKKHILLQQQITRRRLCFPHSYLLSSFPSHLSHLSCNRLSSFAVAPAFMECIPKGVRVIVCLFLKAGVKSKDHSWMNCTSDVGVSKQQSTILRHRHTVDLTCFFSQITIRLVALVNMKKCLVFLPHHHFISQVLRTCILYFLFSFFLFVYLFFIVCIWRG